MLKVSLLNMPFASLAMPSIGLTQLSSVVKREFRDKVSVDLHYINQDFGPFIGLRAYEFVSHSGEAHNSGLGEWFFRQAAFPELPENSDTYFRRYFPLINDQNRMYKHLVESKRRALPDFLDALITKYALDEADLVGFTSMFSQNAACFAMANEIKRRNPNVIVVMGGANCEAPMGQEIVKNLNAIDFVCSGPALKSFSRFVGHLLNGEHEQLHTINGVFSKKNCEAPRPQAILGKPIQPSVIGDELEIDEVIELDYGPFLDRVEANFPDKEIAPVLLFETSRGCWWGEKAHCTFCGLNGLTMTYRAMSPQNAIEQLGSLFIYAPRCSYFNCVDNIMPKSYLREVFPFIETPANVTIFYEVKADLTEEDLQVLAKARVNSIQPGIESLATSTLKLMKKGTTAFQNVAFLKDCVMFNILPAWNLLVGFPGEGEEVYKKYITDIPLLMHLYPPDGVFPVRFDRYSPYFTKAKQYELDLHPVDYYSLTFPFSEESLENLAYYFADHNFSAKYFTTVVNWIGKVREKFDEWFERWHGDGQTTRPSLYFKQIASPAIVYDSRSGEVIEHTISKVGGEILNLLKKPKRANDLRSELSHVPHLDLENEVALLRAQGLIFQEGERLLSLVIPKAPPIQ